MSTGNALKFIWKELASQPQRVLDFHLVDLLPLNPVFSLSLFSTHLLVLFSFFQPLYRTASHKWFINRIEIREKSDITPGFYKIRDNEWLLRGQKKIYWETDFVATYTHVMYLKDLRSDEAKLNLKNAGRRILNKFFFLFLLVFINDSSSLLIKKKPVRCLTHLRKSKNKILFHLSLES